MRKLTILLILSSLILISGCAGPKKSEFAIYLLTQNVILHSDPLKSDYDSIKLEDTPIISSNDIIRYYKKTHEIELTPAAFERIKKLDVPGGGRDFAVCIDRNPIYFGAFWNPVSSLGFGGIVIMKPFGTDKRIIQIQLGYPASKFFKGDDPRSNQKIFQSLRQKGKLR